MSNRPQAAARWPEHLPVDALRYASADPAPTTSRQSGSTGTGRAAGAGELRGKLRRGLISGLTAPVHTDVIGRPTISSADKEEVAPARVESVPHRSLGDPRRARAGMTETGTARGRPACTPKTCNSASGATVLTGAAARSLPRFRLLLAGADATGSAFAALPRVPASRGGPSRPRGTTSAAAVSHPRRFSPVDDGRQPRQT